MNYDFDKILNRKNTNCLKWDFLKERFGADNLLPLWIADMDFRAPEPVLSAIRKTAGQGTFGYSGRPQAFYSSIISWMKKRHGVKIDPEWIVVVPGVLAGMCTAIRAFTKPGDKIIIQTPVYPPFSSIVTTNNRKLVINRLKIRNGRCEMDLAALEKQIDKRTKMLFLCSPDNPVGRVWEKQELEKLSRICLKNNILVISDEIHSDIIFKGHKHVPFLSLSAETAKNSITCLSPGKTFSLAGLYISAIIIPDAKLRKEFYREVEAAKIEASEPFAITAFEAAYSHGEKWLEAALEYLEKNADFLVDFVSKRMPALEVIKPEGTFLAWINFNKVSKNPDTIRNLLVKKAKVALMTGSNFGPGGDGYYRLNFACPRSILKTCLERIEKVF
ncbi:MAG: cystathionine beta-lyase [Elusimicrobia bacterium RIFOXYB2_FULL_48_7]|nr:MAG: cystathionine beta-lyase [Elusimicrobia bacterium RIFOXYB2_FULL_48_7]